MPPSDLIPSKRLELTPAAVAAAELELLQRPQADCPLVHRFMPHGLVVRELKMPAGTLIIGHAHRFADLNLMLTGRLTLLNEDGTTRELTAPQTFRSAPGRKIAYIHEDVIWQNIWPSRRPDGTDLGTDIEALENYYLDKSPGWVANREQRLALDRMARQPDRESFAAFLYEHDLPREDVRRISECEADQIPMPAGDWKFQIGLSAIEGKGVLATSAMTLLERIAPLRLGGMRTPAGRFCNHAANPNAHATVDERGDLWLMASREIAGCAGGQPGEEITVNYNQVLQANAQSVLLAASLKGKHLCQP